MKNRILPFITLILSFNCTLFATTTDTSQNNTGRKEMTISGKGWKIWLDSAANWQKDTLFLPFDLDLKKLPVNQPSCSWDTFYQSKGIIAKVPASFEEIFGKGDPTWRYHGVGWFFKEIDIPKDWASKTVQIELEKARLRIEIYINESLAGYDIIAETPYKTDISKYIKAGQKNRIAIRITNPGGQRGWNDSQTIEWGKTRLIPGHDFGGIGGDIVLTATDPCYIDDLFVKNLLPAQGKNIEVQTFIKNKKYNNQEVSLKVDILSVTDNNSVYSKQWNVTIRPNELLKFAQTISVPSAKLWDIDNPNLYYCTVTISDNGISDSYTQRFGFRTFEVKANSAGEQNFQLNGKRIRLRSAIDWGYYGQTGFYATPEMARKSVENAKAIGHNCINFHRRIGEPLVMKYADELGLLIYEEPGGGPGVDGLNTPSSIENMRTHLAYFSAMSFPEKFNRMVLRDRNHPSLVIYSISNEQCIWDYVHKKIFNNIVQLDNSRLLVNQSGGQSGGPSGYIPHIKPYQFIPTLNYIDDHTVAGALARFQEKDFTAHITNNDSCITIWGEVRCYAGPSNHYLLSRSKDNPGYDYNSFVTMGNKIEQYFKTNNLAQTGSKIIQSPADLTVQAGRGLMYIDGRLSQSIMIHNSEDGYAINGWSDSDLSLGNDMLGWHSSICDIGRNLKGPSTDYKYWVRELQLAVIRQNGKYFNVGDTALIDIHLINEGKLTAGNYKLVIKVKDGSGSYTSINITKEVNVKGGDTYAQVFIRSFPVVMQKKWKAGYITLECKLMKVNQMVATGTEQVLLKNRSSYSAELKNLSGSVFKWEAAKKAIDDAGGIQYVYSKANKNVSFIAAGEVPDDKNFEGMLKQIENDGTTLIIKFDSTWTNTLSKYKVLKNKVTEWGGYQKTFWNGNGWGYLDYYIGNQSIPSGSTIGTNSWEVPCDPKGFAPFESNYPQQSFGAFFFNPDKLLTLIGVIQFGKGKIILAPSYPVDLDNPFSDLLFYNMIINH